MSVESGILDNKITDTCNLLKLFWSACHYFIKKFTVCPLSIRCKNKHYYIKVMLFWLDYLRILLEKKCVCAH